MLPLNRQRLQWEQNGGWKPREWLQKGIKNCKSAADRCNHGEKRVKSGSTCRNQAAKLCQRCGKFCNDCFGMLHGLSAC
jgi:hypothetical protein